MDITSEHASFTYAAMGILSGKFLEDSAVEAEEEIRILFERCRRTSEDECRHRGLAHWFSEMAMEDNLQGSAMRISSISRGDGVGAGLA